MGLVIDFDAAVIHAILEHAPPGGDTWLTVEELASRTGVGLGKAAVTFKAATKRGLVEQRMRANGQPEHRATDKLGVNDAGPMYDSTRGRGKGLG